MVNRVGRLWSVRAMKSNDSRQPINRRQLLGLGASALMAASLSGCAQKDSNAEAARGKTQAAVFSATRDNVRLIGRTCEQDGATWLPQSGSAIEFAAQGMQIKLELAGDESVDNGHDLQPRFAILVDGEAIVDDVLGERSRTVAVQLGDEPVDAVITVMHLSEASRGAMGVRQIAVESDGHGTVAPTQGKSLAIEFIGDSITCAYGVEAAGTDEPFKTTTESFLKSYAYLTAQALDADYSAVCYSGYGVVSGWSGDGTRNERMLLPPLYGLVAQGFDELWDFEAHPCDVVVVNLGTNDFTYTGTDATRMEEFAAGYADFLAQVRERNPESLIVCTLGTMWGCEALYPAVEQAVENHQARTGDERVICFAAEPLDEEKDGCGTSGHPNETTQRKIAEALIAVIRQELQRE